MTLPGTVRLLTPKGEILLRPEQPEHAAFLFQLFAANAHAELSLAALPPTVLEHLVTLQYRAQSQAYRAAFPHGRFFVVERAGRLIGRLVEDDEPGCVHIVDIALLPDLQGQGLGGALLGARMADWRAAGLGARSQVLASNARSLRLHRQLGFVAARAPVGAHLTLTWTPACVEAGS